MNYPVAHGGVGGERDDASEPLGPRVRPVELVRILSVPAAAAAKRILIVAQAPAENSFGLFDRDSRARFRQFFACGLLLIQYAWAP